MEKFYCYNCGEKNVCIYIKGELICEECKDLINDTTGYCDIDCCLGQGCSGTC